MLQRALRAFRAPPDAPRLDPALAGARYARLRNLVLYGSMVGYGLFYFCRNNLKIALPLLQEDLKFTNDEVGQLGSLLYVTYGLSKFGTGLIADRANARMLIVTGLVLSGFINVWFGLSRTLGTFCFLWALNGFVQSFGAPASAKLLANWFTPSERGTKTGIWNISHQGGGGLVLSVAGFFAAWGQAHW